MEVYLHCSYTSSWGVQVQPYHQLTWWNLSLYLAIRLKGNRSLFSVLISAYFGQFRYQFCNFALFSYIFGDLAIPLLWRMQRSRYMSLTIAPVHNSAGRQAQSPASSTLSPKRDPTTEDPDEASSVSSVSESQDKGDKQACTSKFKEK